VSLPSFVHGSIACGLLDPTNPHHVRHHGVLLPIETCTLETTAHELDFAVAVAEVYRTDPSFAAPPTVWRCLAKALPILLGESWRPIDVVRKRGGGGVRWRRR